MAKKAGREEGPAEDRNEGQEEGRNRLKRLRKLIKNTRAAMLTTVASDGSLRSRPMATIKAPFDGTLWFVTRASAPKSDEIKDNQNVNVTYAAPDDERFVSVSGTANLVRDAAKVAELWTRRLREWFPEGKKDPELALIRVKVQHAEFWDSKSASMVRLPDVARALAARSGSSTGAATTTAQAPVSAGA
jgi:general stress protein 26